MHLNRTMESGGKRGATKERLSLIKSSDVHRVSCWLLAGLGRNKPAINIPDT